MTDPEIPAKYAELVHVALAVLVAQLKKEGHPTANFETIIKSYEQSRDRVLSNAGCTPTEIAALTAAAAESLTDWLEEKAEREDREDAHFLEWAKELETENE